MSEFSETARIRSRQVSQDCEGSPRLPPYLFGFLFYFYFILGWRRGGMEGQLLARPTAEWRTQRQTMDTASGSLNRPRIANHWL